MSKKILVVEDTEDNRQILRDLLGMAGYEMVEAHDGAQGVAMAAEHRPDLILMDLLMPHMDGSQATRQIMASSPCAILVVTATVSGNISLVYDAMGYGALDAVDTPMLGPAGEVSGAGALVEKIGTIAKLVGASADPRRSQRPTAGSSPPRLLVIGDKRELP